MSSRGSKDDDDPEEEEEEDGEDKTPTKDIKEIYHLGYLHSWPLVGTGTSGTEVIQIPKLDFEAEKGLLMDSLKNSNKKIRVRMEAATSTSLQFLLTAGCRALHYTGHGQKDCLAFEDGAGKMHRIDSKTLKKMVSAGQKVPKFVLVSACHSETSGMAFVEAGVPHVIAVRSESQIQDKSSQVFMQALYTGLWFGDTIQTAFKKGVAAVMAAPHQTNLDEHRQFLLLPEYKNHNVRIFDDIEEGSWINDSPKPIPHMIPILTEYFQARNVELQKIVSLLQHPKKRLVTITAEEGMGKSTIAIAAARYCQERRFFEGVYFIELAKIEEGASIASFVDSYLEIPGPTPSGPIKTSDLCAKLKEKKFLFVLDEGDDLVAESKKRSPRCLRTFIEDILTRCGNIKMLVTCRSRLGGMGSFAFVSENLLTLETLAPTAAAQMFWDYASREVTFKDLHCSDIKRFSQNLAQHEVLKLLGGHPGKIYHTAQLLSPECKFDDLPAKIKEMEDERKSREEGRKKEKALRLETPTGGGPTAGEGSTPTGPSVVPPTSPTPGLTIRTTSLQRVPSKRDGESESERAWRQEFGDQTLVAWSDFKQFIQRHFIVTAKVDYRPLSAQDLATIRQRVEQGGVKDHVSLTTFQGFWPWWLSFEKAVGMIRAEWCRDNPTLIFGLCSRVVAEKQLEDSPVGTFLLRFSETQSGKMALAYVDSAPPYIKHSLIDIKSTGLYMNVQEPTKPVDYPFATLKELVTDCRLLHKFYPDHDKREVFADEDDGPH